MAKGTKVLKAPKGGSVKSVVAKAQQIAGAAPDHSAKNELQGKKAPFLSQKKPKKGPY